MNVPQDNCLIFGIEQNENSLASKTAKCLNLHLSQLSIKKFSDGEWFLRLLETVRNRKCYIVASTSSPVNENLMLLMILVDCLKRASAAKITAIIPYFGYARQDRRNNNREPITAKLVADLLATSGVDNAILMDIHTDQLQGFFSFPTDNMNANIILLDEFMNDWLNNHEGSTINASDFVLVSPDYGGVKRIRVLADMMHLNIAIVDKKRVDNDEVEIENILGTVANKHCIVVDDIIDTGGTMVGACKLLKANNAKSITCICTHPVLTGDAYTRLNEAFCQGWIDDLYVSNSIQVLPQFKAFKQLHIVSLEGFIAKLIHADLMCSSYYQVVQSYVDDFMSKVGLIKK